MRSKGESSGTPGHPSDTREAIEIREALRLIARALARSDAARDHRRATEETSTNERS
jgi:hypothetical protein